MKLKGEREKDSLKQKSLLWHISSKTLLRFQFSNISYGIENIIEWERQKLRQGSQLKNENITFLIILRFSFMIYLYPLYSSFIRNI